MNIAFVLSYTGTNFHGWQKQANASTIQETLETALYRVTGQQVHISGCGRTDAGVHARIYVANAKLETTVPTERLPFALNFHLPDDICVFRALEVPDIFDARFSCDRKEYTYHIYNSKFKDPFYLNRVGYFPYTVDPDAMAEAASYFVGTHDFKAVRTVGSHVKTTVRTIYHCRVAQEAEMLRVTVCADGFLYNMVRAITGTLLYAGLGKIKPHEITEILDGGDRAAAGPTVPPDGLFMTGLRYRAEDLGGIILGTPDADGLIRSVR